MSHTCKICNKQYVSYQSWWNHNKKFHEQNVDISEKHTNSSDYIQKSDIKTYLCRKCNTEFTNVKTRWSHEKKCKKDINIKESIEEQNLKLQLELKREEVKILELKLKLQESKNAENNIILEKLEQLLELENIV